MDYSTKYKHRNTRLVICKKLSAFSNTELSHMEKEKLNAEFLGVDSEMVSVKQYKAKTESIAQF